MRSTRAAGIDAPTSIASDLPPDSPDLYAASPAWAAYSVGVRFPAPTDEPRVHHYGARIIRLTPWILH